MRRTRQYYIIRSVIFSSIVYFFTISMLAYNAYYTPIIEEEEGIFIELEEFIPPPINLNQIPEDLLSSEDRRNIAVNKAMNSQAETDPYDYSDIKPSDESYKENLVKEALSEEEYKKIFERDDWEVEENVDNSTETETEEKAKDEPSNFKGATYISYFLKDRYKMKIPIPTYRCETSGKVSIDIVVNQKGKVVSYSISEQSSLDDCLRKAALSSVMNAKFNQNFDAPAKQKGSIAYIFEAQ